MPRKLTWAADLFGVVRSYQHTPFAWGKHDCTLFAGRCVDAMTDSELVKSFPYCDKPSAIDLLRREGGLEAAVTKRIGEPVPGHNARRGDVCLVDTEEGLGLGVCVGAEIAVAAEDGLEYYPLEKAHKTWRVD